MTVYTLFGQSGSGADSTDPNPYTIGIQFSVSTPSTLSAIWFYSLSGYAVLPQTIALYTAAGLLVTSQSATWSGVAGSGWVRASVTSPPSLTPGTAYEACVLQTTSADWYSNTASYWTSGAGSGGITNGPLSAPSTAAAVSPGQQSYNSSATLAFPGTLSSGTNFWIDPEVTTPTTPAGQPLPNFPVIITSNAGWRSAGHSR